MKVLTKVSVVFDIKDKQSAGKFYTRLGDAKNYAKRLNQWMPEPKYDAAEFDVVWIEHEDKN